MLYSDSTTDMLSRNLYYYHMYNMSMQLAKPLQVDDISGYFVTHLSVIQRWKTCAKRLVLLPAASIPAAHRSRPPLKSYKCIILARHSFPNDPPLKISLFILTKMMHCCPLCVMPLMFLTINSLNPISALGLTKTRSVHSAWHVRFLF